jgi:cytochrome c-type biogenesis protein CcmF
MHLTAHMVLVLAMLLCLGLAGAACIQSWRGGHSLASWLENGHILQTGLISASCAVLLIALAGHDYSYQYVANYTDNFLPFFYTLTAFWAGQAGSMLFWAWCVAIFGLCFSFTASYRMLAPATKLHFWLFFLATMGFFLLLLVSWSNPFLELIPAPADGNGLNPLLRNPGMIFHPPLLFLGYAGFTIPACLAMAAMVSGQDRKTWLPACRNILLLSWLFLTAGIVLGGWWSYMELGWGGYWAWDPVENASLIPWLAATALLHTGVAESRRGVLRRTNVLLAVLTLVLCFLATYLVRSGVVDSLHAFGGSGVGLPLLIFILAVPILVIATLLTTGGEKTRPLAGIFQREGFLFLAACVLLTIGLIILMGTFWPVLSQLWSDAPTGLDQGFYNRVCLPLFALLTLMLALCPWLGWKGGVRNKKAVAGLIIFFVAVAVGLWLYGIRLPTALVGAAGAVACLAGILMLFLLEPSIRRRRTAWGAYGVHVGLALMVLGISFSGPYQVSREAVLGPGETITLEEYDITHDGLRQDETTSMVFIESTLTVSKDGRKLGTLTPQRRLYRKFDSPFAEVSVIPGLGDELYATLLSADEDDNVTIKVSVNPLVNWIWIGGTLMCLFPLLALTRRKERKA